MKPDVALLFLVSGKKAEGRARARGQWMAGHSGFAAHSPHRSPAPRDSRGYCTAGVAKPTHAPTKYPVSHIIFMRIYISTLLGWWCLSVCLFVRRSSNQLLFNNTRTRCTLTRRIRGRANFCLQLCKKTPFKGQE